MKKILLYLMLLIVASATTFAQDSRPALPQGNPFPSLSSMKGVETVFLGKAMLKLAGSMNIGVPDIGNIIDSIDCLGVYEISSKRAGEEAEKQVTSFAKEHSLEIMMSTHEDDESMTMYGLPEEDGTLRMILLINQEENETDIIYINGRISPSEISKIANLN